MKTAILSLALLACGGAVADPNSTSSTPTQTTSPGACTSETLANDAVDYGRLAVDGATVFWDTADGRLVRHDSAGNTKLADISFTYIAVDATNVYGATLDSIVAVPRAGGAPVTLTSDRALSLVVRDDTLFYVSEADGAIVALGPLDGAPVRTVLVDQLSNPYELAVDDTSVYFECGGVGSSPLTLWRASRSATAGQAPVLLATTNELGSLAASNGTVYYADGTDTVTAGILDATNPGATQVVVPSSNVSILNIILDGNVGYHDAADNSVKPTYHDRIYRFALDGSDNTLLVDVGADTLVATLKASGDALYFTTLSGPESNVGTVRKICR